jgi:hypothetical protein
MLTDEQKTLVVELLNLFRAACPHYVNENPDQQAMIDEIIVVLSKGP